MSTLGGQRMLALIHWAIYSMQANVVTLPYWPTCCVNADVRLHCNPPPLSAFVRIFAYPLHLRCGRPLWMTPTSVSDNYD